MAYDPASAIGSVVPAVPASNGSSQRGTFGGGAAPWGGWCSAAGASPSGPAFGAIASGAFGDVGRATGGGIGRRLGSAEDPGATADGCGLTEMSGAARGPRSSGALGTLACIATSATGATGLRFDGMAATYAALAPSTAATLNGRSLRFWKDPRARFSSESSAESTSPAVRRRSFGERRKQAWTMASR